MKQKTKPILNLHSLILAFITTILSFGAIFALKYQFLVTNPDHLKSLIGAHFLIFCWIIIVQMIKLGYGLVPYNKSSSYRPIFNKFSYIIDCPATVAEKVALAIIPGIMFLISLLVVFGVLIGN